MAPQIDDMQLEREIRGFLRSRAEDTLGVRDADAMTRAIARQVSTQGGRRVWTSHLVWIVVAAALLIVLAISAVMGGAPRRVVDATEPTPSMASTELRRAAERILLRLDDLARLVEIGDPYLTRRWVFDEWAWVSDNRITLTMATSSGHYADHIGELLLRQGDGLDQTAAINALLASRHEIATAFDLE